MYKMFEKDNLKLYVGVVAEGPVLIDRDGNKSVVMVLKDYVGDKIEIYFDNAAEGSPKAQMLADRIINAKVGIGAFLSVLATANEEEVTANGVDFKYRGVWDFPDENISVLMGVALKPRQPKDGMYCITIPVDQYKDGQKSTLWCDVTFFDGEKDGRTWTNATHAARVLHGEDKPTVVVVGSPIAERQYNGKTYHSMKGYRISKRPS